MLKFFLTTHIDLNNINKYINQIISNQDENVIHVGDFEELVVLPVTGPSDPKKRERLPGPRNKITKPKQLKKNIVTLNLEDFPQLNKIIVDLIKRTSSDCDTPIFLFFLIMTNNYFQIKIHATLKAVLEQTVSRDLNLKENQPESTKSN